MSLTLCLCTFLHSLICRLIITLLCVLKSLFHHRFLVACWYIAMYVYSALTFMLGTIWWSPLNLVEFYWVLILNALWDCTLGRHTMSQCIWVPFLLYTRTNYSIGDQVFVMKMGFVMKRAFLVMKYMWKNKIL